MARALVVEDDPSIARICVRLLAHIGLDALVAATGQDALDCLADESKPFDFAYVDVGLPDMSGLDVVAQFRTLRPALPILISTGRVEDVPAMGCAVLRKPFTLEQFRSAVDQCMAKARP